MDLSAAGHRNEVSGAGGGADVFTPPPEYHQPLYFDSADTEAMSGGGATNGGVGVNEMVGAGQTRPRACRDRDGDGYVGVGVKGRRQCVGGGVG